MPRTFLRLARRALAALAALSVLATALGWTDACGDASAGMQRGGGSGHQDGALAAVDGPDSPSHDCPDPAQSSTPAKSLHGTHAPGCVLPAHCTAALVGPSAVVPTFAVIPAVTHAWRTEARPLSPTAQPVSPPPRV